MNKLHNKIWFLICMIFLSVTLFLTGCTLSKKGETTLQTTEETGTDAVTEEPVLLTPTLDYFENVSKDSSIEDIENEIGPFTKSDEEDLKYYIWRLDDGSDAKVYVTPSDEKICRIQIVNKNSEYDLYNLWNAVPGSFHSFDVLSGKIKNEPINVNGYEYILLDRTEYGPDFERGWYIKEEEDAKYIMICAGRENPDDPMMYVSYIKYWESGKTENYDKLTLKVDFDESDETDVQEGYKYPCCTLKCNKFPSKVIITTEDETEIPFGGYIADMEDWSLDAAIEDNYEAVFTDGGTDREKRTYYYSTEDYGYRYINAVVTPEAGESKILVKGTGYLYYKRDIVDVAKKFGSCRFVMVPGEEDTLTDVNEYIANDSKLQ